MCTENVRSRNYVIFSKTLKYVGVLQNKIWNDANEYCKTMFKSHLAVIKSSIDTKEVKSITQSDRNFWIGYSDRYGERKFSWVNVDNSSKSYTNWGIYEPDKDSDENCAYVAKNGKWYDSDCYGVNNFICQCKFM